MPAIQIMSHEELGRQLHSAVQTVVDQEVEAAIDGIRELVAERIREKLGKLASNVTASRQFGMPEITISVKINAA